MKAMMTGFAAIVVIGVAAHFGMAETGFSSGDVYSGDNVRLK